MAWRRQWHPTPVLLPGNPMDGGAWWAAVHEITKGQTRLSDLTFTFHFHALEEEMATHSSVLAWRIPGTGEPGGLPSTGSHRVGHYWSDLAAAAARWWQALYIHHVKSITPLQACTLETFRIWFQTTTVKYHNKASHMNFLGSQCI